MTIELTREEIEIISSALKLRDAMRGNPPYSDWLAGLDALRQKLEAILDLDES